MFGNYCNSHYGYSALVLFETQSISQYKRKQESEIKETIFQQKSMEEQRM